MKADSQAQFRSEVTVTMIRNLQNLFISLKCLLFLLGSILSLNMFIISEWYRKKTAMTESTKKKP